MSTVSTHLTARVLPAQHRLRADDSMAGYAAAIEGVTKAAETGRATHQQITDALALVEDLHRELDKAQRALIEAGRSDEPALGWKEIADALGLRSRQAAERRLLRIQAAAAAGGRDADVGRRLRST